MRRLIFTGIFEVHIDPLIWDIWSDLVISNKKQKRKLAPCGSVPVDSGVKLVKRNNRQIFGPCLRTKKKWGICRRRWYQLYQCIWNITNEWKEDWNREKSGERIGNVRVYSIFEIAQKTQNFSGDLWWHCLIDNSDSQRGNVGVKNIRILNIDHIN